jgi:hypothetical protein
MQSAGLGILERSCKIYMNLASYQLSLLFL